jgi:hypothetical protein
MNHKERVRATFAHREPDRVPLFELTIANPVLESVLGRRIMGFGTGEAKAAGIRAAMRGGGEHRPLIRENVTGMMEMFEKAGYDMFWWRPTDYLACVMEGLPDDITANSIFDISVRETAANTWRIESPEHGFWSVEKYEPDSDTCVTVQDSIQEGGLPELRRYVEYLERHTDAQLHPHLRDGLEAIRIAVARQKARGDDGLFVMGAADIACPTFLPFLPLFLETMVDEPSLVQRYMEATTEGVLTILRAELDMGVDGILGAEDWCFGKGPLFSPPMFRRFMAPSLKRIADECHRRGVPFIKHLDGNTTVLLDILVDEVGIDGLHSIEPPAGMDIGWVKKRYGSRVTLLGNIDCGHLLTFGTPADVEKAVKDIIRAASPGGGHVFASSNSIHSGVRPEIFRAMVDAVKRWGVYPIQVPA